MEHCVRIGIDGHILGKQKGGVETYVYNVIKGLAGLDHENDYFIYTGKNHPFRPGELPDNFRLSILPVLNPWIERAIVIPALYVRDRLDAVVCQRALPLLGCPRSVLHIHDAQYMTNPELFPLWKRSLLNPVFRRSGRRATSVVTLSEASKRDIVMHYGVDPAKVEVIAPGVDVSSFYPVTDRGLLEDVRGRFGIKGRYVVYLGAIERNKNIHSVIKAFDIFKGSCPEFMLVIVGKLRSETRGGYIHELREIVGSLGRAGDVVFTDHVSDDDRRLLLGGAEMLVFPSKAEGFGLPPLEAMACGVPVVTSNIPALKEAFEGAALMADHDDIKGIAAHMERVVTEAGLAGELKEKGFEKVRQYSWEGMAERLLEVYLSVARGGS